MVSVLPLSCFYGLSRSNRRRAFQGKMGETCLSRGSAQVWPGEVEEDQWSHPHKVSLKLSQGRKTGRATQPLTLRFVLSEHQSRWRLMRNRFSGRLRRERQQSLSYSRATIRLSRAWLQRQRTGRVSCLPRLFIWRQTIKTLMQRIFSLTSTSFCAWDVDRFYGIPLLSKICLPPSETFHPSHLLCCRYAKRVSKMYFIIEQIMYTS